MPVNAKNKSEKNEYMYMFMYCRYQQRPYQTQRRVASLLITNYLFQSRSNIHHVWYQLYYAWAVHILKYLD
jgi:hypothetical protein